jgi:hypothetical protein
MCAQANATEERAEGGREAAAVERRGGGGAERDVAQVPARIRQVKDRDEVAPAAGPQGVERWALQTVDPLLSRRNRAFPR